MTDGGTGSADALAERVSLWARNPAIEPASHSLEVGTPARLGRSTQNDITVLGDRALSRRHVTLRWDGSRLQISCFENARNPIVIGQQAVRSARVRLGDVFAIGGTIFQLVAIDAITRDVGNVRASTHAGQVRL